MSDPVVIDAKDLILGRVCSHVAKQALYGREIAVVNVEQIVLTGKRETVMARYRNLREKGEPVHGPFLRRSAKDLFKRTLKKMLPYKTSRGVQALKRVKAYKGVPARFAEGPKQSIEGAHYSKLPTTKYVRLQDVTNFIGGK